ncbi:hypothetical protein BB561_003614 [Smittium simulii]|uniref:SCD domain-containing protein n=1 Tax=Smittium simulii TaxID=133385 RepID=A0A2T9YKD9_9FUNG|nr:hypothetical protein BB561_003614 [Smittium simulii]
MSEAIPPSVRASTSSATLAKNSPAKNLPSNKRPNVINSLDKSPKPSKKAKNIKNADILSSPPRRLNTPSRAAKKTLQIPKIEQDSHGSESESGILEQRSESSSDASEPELSEEEEDFYQAKRIVKNRTISKKKNIKTTPKPRSNKKKTLAQKPTALVSNDLAASIDYCCPLFSEIIFQESTIDKIAQSWISSYCSTNDEAIIEFVNLTLRASGALGSIEPSELYSKSSMEKSLDRLRIEANKSKPKLEPLISSKSKADKTKLNLFAQFINTIIKKASDVLIFGDNDQELDSSFQKNYLDVSTSQKSRFSLFFTVIGSWLEILSMNEYRPFRQTGTFVIFNIQTSIAVIKKTVRDNLSTVRRQILEDENKNAAKKSNKSSKSLRRVQLDERESELLLQTKILSERSDLILEKVLQFRYRDVYPSIRSECASFISDWIIKDSASFLKTNYLRYFGWLWHDSDEKVRLSSIDNVKRIINVGGSVAPMLRSFFDRFGSRLLQLAIADSDNNVMVAALKLTVKVIENGMLVTDENTVNSAVIQIKSKNKNKASGKILQATPRRKTKKTQIKNSPSFQNFSQQLLYESDDSSESSHSDQQTNTDKNLKDNQDDVDSANKRVNSTILDLYDFTYNNFDNQTEKDLFASNKAVGYLASLIVHSQPSVRSAAGMIVYQWIIETWLPSIKSNIIANNQVDNTENLNDESISELNEKWALYKSVALFLSQIDALSAAKISQTKFLINNLSSDENICSTDDDVTQNERIWNQGREFLSNLQIDEKQKLNFSTESVFGFGKNSSWVIASANSFYGKSAYFMDIDSVLGYLSEDHSKGADFNKLNQSQPLNSILILTKEQEIALLKAVLIWIGTQKSSLISKAKNSNNKIGISAINQQLYSLYKGFAKWINTLILRYRDQPQFLETLLSISVYGLSTQYYFDSGKLPELELLSSYLVQAIERNRTNIAICQLSVYLLAKIDESQVLDMSGTKISSVSARESKLSTKLGTILSKLVISSIKDIYLNSRIGEYNEKSLLGSLMCVRAILYDKDILEIAESTGKELESDDLSLYEDDQKISPVFKKLQYLALGNPLTGLNSDNTDQSCITIYSMNIVFNMLAWKSQHVNLGLKTLENQILQKLDDSLQNFDTDSLVTKAKSLVSERDNFLNLCLDFFNNDSTNIHIKITSLIASANIYILFSSDFTRTARNTQDAKSEMMMSVDRIKENLILKVDSETQTAWITSAVTIFNNWSTTILPWAVFVYDFDDGIKIKQNQSQTILSIYSNLIKTIPHNGYIVELARYFSKLITNGVFPFTFIPKVVAYVGKLGSEIVIREFEKKFSKEIHLLNNNLCKQLNLDDLSNVDESTTRKNDKKIQSDSNAADSKITGRKAHNSLKLTGFVALSVFDNIIKNMLDSLKVAIATENLQNYAIRELMKCLQLSFETCITNDLLLKQSGSQVYYKRQLSILPRIISTLLRSASINNAELNSITPHKNSIRQFGPPLVCSLWATLHKAVIKYGFEIIEMCCLEPLTNIVNEIDNENNQSSRKESDGKDQNKKLELQCAYERCSLWYYIISNVVNGLILPKHATIIKDALQKEEAEQWFSNETALQPDINLDAQDGEQDNKPNTDDLEDSNKIKNKNMESSTNTKPGEKLAKELANAALQPYIKVLEDQISKFNVAKTRLRNNTLLNSKDNTDDQLSTPSKSYIPINNHDINIV